MPSEGFEKGHVRQGVNWLARKLGRTSLGHAPGGDEADSEQLELLSLPSGIQQIAFLDEARQRRIEARSAPQDVIKVTFLANAELMEEAQYAADVDGVSVTSFLNQAIADHLYFSEHKRQGLRILVEDARKRVREVVWPQKTG